MEKEMLMILQHDFLVEQKKFWGNNKFKLHKNTVQDFSIINMIFGRTHHLLSKPGQTSFYMEQETFYSLLIYFAYFQPRISKGFCPESLEKYNN